MVIEDNEISSIISCPARVRIIEVIGLKGSASFTVIKNGTDLSTGSIYYHLSYLRDYVTRDNERKYILTEKGKLLIEKLGMTPIIKNKQNFLLNFLSLITLSPLFKKAISTKTNSIILTFFILFLGSIINLNSNLNQILLSVPYKHIMHPVLSTLITGWFLTFILAEIYSFLTTKMIIGGELELGAVIALSFFPLYLYSSIVKFQLSSFILVPLQIWSALLLAGGMNMSKGVKLTNSFIFSLIILYLSIYIWLTI